MLNYRSLGRSSMLLVSLLLVSVAGCSSELTGEVLPTVPVSGLLTYNGKPLEYYQVTFSPADGQRPAVGTSDEQGRFSLGTNRPGDGALVASHAVSVVYVGPPNNDPNFGMSEFDAPPPPQVRVPAKYSDPKKSGISIEVPSGGLVDVAVELN